MLPFHHTYLECLARNTEQAVMALRPVRLGSDVKPPTKVRHVAPYYPESERQAQREGVVVIESTISPNGCVISAVVTRSASTKLDISAMRAVTGWVFSPTLFGGRRVPVLLTVNVRFSLR